MDRETRRLIQTKQEKIKEIKHPPQKRQGVTGDMVIFQDSLYIKTRNQWLKLMSGDKVVDQEVTKNISAIFSAGAAQHSDLTGISENQHHNRQHSLTSGSDHTGTLSVAMGGTGVTSSTGTTNTVLSTSPTFETSITIDQDNGEPAVVLHRDGANPGTSTSIGSIKFNQDYESSAQEWGRIQLQTTDSAARTKLGLWVKQTGGSIAEALTILGHDSGSNVGIGVTNPYALLELSSASDTDYSATAKTDAQLQGGTTLGLVNTNTDDENYAQILFRLNQTNTAIARIVAISESNNNVDLAFVSEGSDSATEKLRIKANGNVGIGTDSPGSYKLKVIDGDSSMNFWENGDNAELRILTKGTDTNEAAVYFGDEGDAVQAGIMYDAGTQKLYIKADNNNNAITIDSAERIGIGVEDPDVRLEVMENTNQLKLSHDADKYTTLGTDLNGKFTINPSGDSVFLGGGTSIGSIDYASQLTGWRITDDGESDFRYMYVDEMHAKAFITDLEQALVGGQIISKSVGVIHADFILPTAGNSSGTFNLTATITCNGAKTLTSVSDTSGVRVGMKVTHASHTDLQSADNVYVESIDSGSSTITLTAAMSGGSALTSQTVTFCSDLRIKDMPGYPNLQVFQDGDWIRFRQFVRGYAMYDKVYRHRLKDLDSTGGMPDYVADANDTGKYGKWQMGKTVGSDDPKDFPSVVWDDSESGITSPSSTLNTTDPSLCTCFAFYNHDVDGKWTQDIASNLEVGSIIKLTFVGTSHNSALREYPYYYQVRDYAYQRSHDIDADASTYIYQVPVTLLTGLSNKTTGVNADTTGHSTDNLAYMDFGDGGTGELLIGDAWGQVVYQESDSNAGTQTWRFTRGPSGSEGTAKGDIEADGLCLDYGTTQQGYYEVNAIDGKNGSNSPYAQVVTWEDPVVGPTDTYALMETDWSLHVAGSSGATQSSITTGEYAYGGYQRAKKITISAADASNNIQFYKSITTTITSGKKYKVRFAARLDSGGGNRNIVVRVHEDSADWTDSGLSTWNVNVRNYWAVYEKEFTATATFDGSSSADRARLDFYLGDTTQDIYFGYARIYEVTGPGGSDALTVKSRYGNLAGIGVGFEGEYGLYAGNGGSKYIIASTDRLQLKSSDYQYIDMSGTTIDIYDDISSAAKKKISIGAGNITMYKDDGVTPIGLWDDDEVKLGNYNSGSWNVDAIQIIPGGVYIYDNSADYCKMTSGGFYVYEGGSQVANFAATTVIGSTTDKITISSSGITLREGNADKITLASGNITLTGKIIADAAGDKNVVIGNDNADVGVRNILLGDGAGNGMVEDNAYNQDNIYIGTDAGKEGAGISGNTNTANVCIGTSAGKEAVGANYCVYIGNEAGHGSSNSAKNNVAIGYQALYSINNNDTSSSNSEDNVAIGFKAGYAVTGGKENTLMGYAAGDSITSGDYNVCIGTQAGHTITTSSYNVAIGWYAGASDSASAGGNYNTNIGARAGQDITTGDYNVCIGYLAGANFAGTHEITTGLRNIHIGYGTSNLNADDDDTIVIGQRVVGKGEDTVVIGHSNITQFWCGTDADPQIMNMNGKISSGRLEVTSTDSTSTDATICLFRGTGRSDFTMGTEKWHICSDDSASDGFCIRRQDPSSSNVLTIAQDGTFAGSASADISDRDLKENITDITNGLATINQLQGRTFTWKSSANMQSGTKYGLIAQELEAVLPDLVINHTGIRQKEDGTFYKSVNTSGIIPVLIEAVKELSAKVTALESKLA